MRLIALTLSLGLLLFTSCTISIFGLNNHQAEVELSHTFPVTNELQFLDFKTHNGRIDILPSENNEIRIDATVRLNASTEKKALDDITEVKLMDDWSDNNLKLLYHCPNNNDLSASATIWVPEHCLISLSSSNGRISISGDFPEVYAHTSNGRISLAGTAPKFKIGTSNGRIEIALKDDWQGSGEAKTSNGAISVTCTGALLTHVDAKTSNGSSQITTQPGDGMLQLTTSNGKITVK